MSVFLVAMFVALAGAILVGLAILAHDAWVNLPRLIARWLNR